MGEYFVFRSLKRKKIKISMGQSQSVRAPETEAEELSYLTGLEICQIDKLYERFLKLGGEKGHLTRDDLRNCGLESNPLGDRLIDMGIPPQSADADMNMNTETCSFHQFCMVLAHFQPSTSKTQETDINSGVSKGTFIFNSFDKNQDGRIYVHNIEAVLQYMVGASVTDEKVKIIANQIYQDAKARTPDSQPGITFEELALTMKPVNLETKMAVHFAK